MSNYKYIVYFSQIRKDDTSVVGGKGANLGEMTSLGLPIPPGFVINAAAFEIFLKENNLDKKVAQLLSQTNPHDLTVLESTSKKIKKILLSSPIPQEVVNEIASAYRKLSGNFLKPSLPVAVRSSATAEDSTIASFAGQNESYLNIIGDSVLIDAVRKCWASLFDTRSIFYRNEKHLNHFQAKIAVVVQVMIQSQISGIIFSIDPVTNNKDRIIIESVYGLGEYIVGGKVTPDHYEVNKSDLKIIEAKCFPQNIMLIRHIPSGVQQKNVPKQLQYRQKLTSQQIIELASLSLVLEKHYYFPQDSEFAIANGKIYLVQTRPITTIIKVKSISDTRIETKNLPILEGTSASPGIKSGPVKILQSAKEIGSIKPGDVLVAMQTSPDFVPAMKKAIAIITEKGGRTSHAAIVSRELGIPCVVAVDKATKILRNGQVVTVNGSSGKIYIGSVIKNNPITHREPRPTKNLELHTATKIYVNLAEPEKAKEVAALNCDGVGLLRAEFMIAGIGLHPKVAIKEKKQQLYIDSLANQLAIFAQAFYPRPVVYRSSDFKTNEYRALKGGDQFEPIEENPMIGFRGAYRYLIQPDAFHLEISALKKVRETFDYKNVFLMIPFCRTVEELIKVKALIAKFGLQRSNSFKLWMMCEIPSNVILLERFINAGLDGISIGSNDLTMLTMGVDRDNENIASEYDERNEAMLNSFESIIKTCKKYKTSCSMCGQAPSDFPELTEKLVQWGITSVSVNPDALDRTRSIIYEAEKKNVNH